MTEYSQGEYAFFSSKKTYLGCRDRILALAQNVVYGVHPHGQEDVDEIDCHEFVNARGRGDLCQDQQQKNRDFGCKSRFAMKTVKHIDIN